MQINKRQVVRKTIQGIVTICVGATVNNLIENNLSEPEKKRQKAEYKVGGFVLGGMVSNWADKYVIDSMNMFEDSLNHARKTWTETETE